ncbi:hypothetical protein [Pseudomonas sp. CCI1.1]|uniref:hypothetical protein n=1 Tax=Pseudomonas sp. CCI1.1 TaxID=3048613 RepID=UPI002AC9B69C|nr:hypothetical protein [Pseudomonas sp. CCI1.1]MEB0190010.1 hypothetical protein [Pseudomonas sp. CCI1.1]WPX48363.1 hypothetical protein RHM69_29365 [Pseudomonas sp. CCI1.1]
MSHNQTIDGVSRKSLEQALKLAAVFDDGGDGADAESARGVVWILRALLDAPAKPAEGLEADNVKLAADRAALSAELETLRKSYRNVLVLLEAAQPQGEPVAWDIHWTDNGEFYFTLRNQSRLWKYEQDPDFKVVPLYAEHPAPVAVVDALSTGFYTTESGGGKYAINIGFRSMADMQAADAQLTELLKSR